MIRRIALMVLSLASAAAMLYVGLYQLRVVSHLRCPLFGGGCEAVADAPFARPLGVPDGLIAAGLYVVLLALVSVPRPGRGLRNLAFAVSLLALAANILGVVDMARLGQFCFWCTVTAVLSVPIGVLAWPLRRERTII